MIEADDDEFEIGRMDDGVFIHHSEKTTRFDPTHQ